MDDRLMIVRTFPRRTRVYLVDERGQPDADAVARMTSAELRAASDPSSGQVDLTAASVGSGSDADGSYIEFDVSVELPAGTYVAEIVLTLDDEADRVTRKFYLDVTEPVQEASV